MSLTCLMFQLVEDLNYFVALFEVDRPLAARIFNLSLLQATIRPCLKASTIIPIPKKTALWTRTEALTPVVMKSLKNWLPHISRPVCLPLLKHTSLLTGQAGLQIDR